MKKLLYVLGALLTGLTPTGLMADPVLDQADFSRIQVSSTTAATLGAHSNRRVTITCTNADATNTVYIGSTTAITANGANTLPLLKSQAITFQNHTALFAIAEAGVAVSSVSCVSEF